MKTMWRPRLSSNTMPRYRAIADSLEEDIRSGRLSSGERLPTMRDLAVHLGVTLGTVHRAYGLAEKRGLLSREVGRGSFVRGWAGISQDVAEGLLDLTRNRPPEIRIEETLRRALKEMAQHSDLTGMLDYGESQGLARHRHVLARWLDDHGAAFDPDKLIVTSGAQQALTVALAALTQPGDALLVEELTYPGIKSLARIFGLRLEAVSLDEDGLLPDSFESKLAKESGRAFLYCMPNAQNPTTATLTLERRREVVRTAARHSCVIIEDDVNPRHRPQALPPLAALYPDGTVYISSLSKTMAPGLRVGALAAPAALLDDLLAAAQTTNWMAPPLMAELACRWIEDGTADIIEAERNKVISRLKNIAREALIAVVYRESPDNPNLWVPLDPQWQGVDIVAMARARSLLVASAEDFAIQRSTVAPAIRLSLTEPHEERLREGLKTLARLLEEGPGPQSFRM